MTRERKVKGIEKSEREPNAFPKLCEWFSGRFLLKGRGTPDGSLFESKILVKSPKPRNKAQRKVDYKN